LQRIAGMRIARRRRETNKDYGHAAPQ
jgi:hypothetical protein